MEQIVPTTPNSPPAFLPAALNDCHGHAANALKRHMHKAVPVMQAAGVLPHSHQQLPCMEDGVAAKN